MWPVPYTLNAQCNFPPTGGHTMIQQINSLGQVVKVLADGNIQPGLITLIFMMTACLPVLILSGCRISRCKKC